MQISAWLEMSQSSQEEFPVLAFANFISSAFAFSLAVRILSLGKLHPGRGVLVSKVTYPA